FAHGSNDGQKGMGLIMLILIGIVPTAYALNRTMDESHIPAFESATAAAQQALLQQSAGVPAPQDPRASITHFLRTRQMDKETVPALAVLTGDIERQVKEYGALNAVPAQSVQNMRNDMYLAAEAVRLIAKDPDNGLDDAGLKSLKAYGDQLNDATK